MKKISIPERIYYPLPEAAKKLGCTLNDIYHFAAIGALNISVYFPNCHPCKSLVIPKSLVENIDVDSGGMLQGERWVITGMKPVGSDFEWVNYFGVASYLAKNFCGFFYLNRESFSELEFIGNDARIVSSFFSTRPESENWECQIMSDGAIEIDRRFLCVMAKDLEHIKDVGTMPGRKMGESPKTLAKKAELIPALIKLIPEMDDIDIGTAPVAKVIAVLEAAAAMKGVFLPATDKNTWAKYLGRT
ncbi:hypothetical protein ACNCNJ_001409 [Escherichia coli]|nr:hypothetical protein [Escherichia coli]